MELRTIGQLVGLLSFGLAIVTFYQKQDRRLKCSMLIFNLNHLCHFILLGSLPSIIGALLSTLRTTATIVTSSKLVALIFISAGIGLGAYFAQSSLDWLPIVGTCIGTFALFLLQNVVMRIAFIFSSGCWLINNILIGSIGGILLESMVIVVNLCTIWRLIQTPNQATTQMKE